MIRCCNQDNMHDAIDSVVASTKQLPRLVSCRVCVRRLWRILSSVQTFEGTRKRHWFHTRLNAAICTASCCIGESSSHRTSSYIPDKPDGGILRHAHRAPKP